MLRPERMSRVSVTGSKRVMDDAIEAVHDMRLLHVTGYGDDWEGFSPGDPIEGAESAAEKLVTVRSLQSILGVDGEEAGPARLVTEDALDDELEEIRVEVNELDDRRNDLENELKAVEERIDSMEPFAALGIDMDLLSGYDSLEVAVGTGDAEAVRRTLVDAECDYELVVEDGVLGVFARTHGETDLDDVLVGAAFQRVEIPDADGSPEEYLSELEARRQELDSELSTTENQLDELRLEVGGFLLAAEETLAIAVQQQEAPLDFATTENAFVAEGWIPTERFVDLAEGMHAAVGDHVEVDELERAAYDGDGRIRSREDVHDAPTTPAPSAAGDGGRTGASERGRAAGGADESEDEDEQATEEVATDGGHGAAGAAATGAGAADAPMSDDAPPVVQDNPGPVKPFEALVEVINRPNYSELDPTIVLFCTFPLFFGFMIGDVGYGLAYMGLGYLIYSRYDGAIGALGGIGFLSGVFTVLFGVLYGEIFGMHILGQIVWVDGLGLHGPPMHKGLQPADADYAQLWLVLSVLAGIAHVSLGWVFGFVDDLSHGVREAFMENGSWLLMMFGLWTWIFSFHVVGSKPAFLVGPEAVFNGNPVPLGFAGFPEIVGLAGIGAFVLGLGLIATVDFVEAIEAIFLQVLVNALSYTRIAAVLLAKAGMAFVVNLLFFGAYQYHGEFHFLTGKGPEAVEHGTVMFEGLIHMGVGGVLLGIVVVVVGHALVLALGITSAGLQAIRLEYVEFFQKFYEGGGEAYRPFGYERRYTTDD